MSVIYIRVEKNKKMDKSTNNDKDDTNGKRYRDSSSQDRITKFGDKQYRSFLKISQNKHKALKKRMRGNTKRKARYIRK